VRRVLHYSPEEWDVLPWYLQRMFMEQLTTYLNGGKKVAKIDGSTASLAAIGVKTRRVVQPARQ
jgi:hypothetical protein